MKFKLALFFFVFNFTAFTQVDTSSVIDSVYTLETVVISSARSEKSILRVPYSVDLINKDEIQTGKTGLSLDEVLNTIPGMIVHNRNNPSLGDRISIRGIGSRSSFGVRGIKILYDDIPLTLPDGQSQLNNIDLSSAGSIEVLRGPASSLYGNSAGGVINIKTEEAENRSFSFNTSAAAGSNGLQNYNLKVSGIPGKFSYFLSIKSFIYEGFRGHSSSKSNSLNAIVRYTLSENIKIKALINYFDSPYLLNPSSLTKEDAKNSPEFVRQFIIDQGAGEKTSQGEYGISLDIHLSKNFLNKTTFYFVNRSTLNPIPGRIIDLKRSAGGLRSIFTNNFTNNNFEIIANAGIDIEFQNDIRKEFINEGLIVENISPEDIFGSLMYGNSLLDQKENVASIGPFASAEFWLSNKLGFHAGLRYDNYLFKADDKLLADGDDSGERRMENLSPMAGIIFLPGESTKIYANFITSFQTPTTSELSNLPSGEGGFNPSLNPEKLRSIEVGFFSLFKRENINIEAAIFLMNFEDMLISYQVQNSNSEEIFFRNAGKAENKGCEVKINWIPFTSIILSAAYTFMDFKFIDYSLQLIEAGSPAPFIQLKGNKLPGIPQNVLYAGFKFKSSSGIYSEINFQWLDKYFTNDFNGPAPGSNKDADDFINDSYAKVDAAAGYIYNFDLLSAGIFFGIKNVFNERYNSSIVPNAAGERFFEPSSDRNWYLKLELKF